MRAMDVEGELQQLVGEIKRLGSRGPNGYTSVSFGKLVNDERCSQICAITCPSTHPLRVVTEYVQRQPGHVGIGR